MSTSSTPARPVSRGREVRTGLRDATPLALGALPFGLLFGAVAQQADLSLLDTMLLSALVNGGSAQMIATGLMASGTVWFVVVATCLVVNMRHVFYSAALSAKVRHLPTLWRVVLAYGLIDAIYVLAAKRYEAADGRRGQQHWYVLAASLLMYAGWLSSTLVGFLFGKDVTRIDGLGLDFAIYATYIGLVVSCFTSKRAVAAGLVGGALALALHRLPYQSGLFCATLAATVTLALWEGRARADDCTPGSPEQEPTAKG
ncbi:AzlC family ABC transporter permease [Streptomyces pratensis]|uniref:AzlC family ABC transporter permease n=1 Tax=Streptomyces pratensis TaxID=1169025 RepID=UPI001932A9FC|nr:AzlC family ABC transporter permease [Streptomyces pratensis]